jgi:hypothetical protein
MNCLAGRGGSAEPAGVIPGPAPDEPAQSPGDAPRRGLRAGQNVNDVDERTPDPQFRDLAIGAPGRFARSWVRLIAPRPLVEVEGQ